MLLIVSDRKRRRHEYRERKRERKHSKSSRGEQGPSDEKKARQDQPANLPYPVYDKYRPYGQSQPPLSLPYPGYGAYPGYNQPHIAPGPPQYPAYNQPPPGGYPRYPPPNLNYPPPGYPPSGFPPPGVYRSAGPPPLQSNPLTSPQPSNNLVDPDKLLCPVPACHGKTFNMPAHVKDHWFKIHEQHPVIVYYCAKCSWSVENKLILSFHYQNIHRMGDKEVEAVVGRSRSKRYEFNTHFIDPGQFKLKSISYDYDDRKEKSPASKSSDKTKSVKDEPGYIYFDAADLVCRVNGCHGKVFNRPEHVIDHWRKVHKQHPILEYYCSECPYSIDDIRVLKFHYRIKHQIEDPNKLMKSNTKNFPINCRYVDPGKFRLRGEDTDSKEGTTPPDTTEEVVKKNPSSKLPNVIYVDPDSCKCPVSMCGGKEFQNTDHFINHWYVRHHQHPIRNYLCNMCTLKAVDKNFLKIHLSSKHNVNWRSCPFHFETHKVNICYLDPGRYRMKDEHLESIIGLMKSSEEPIHPIKETMERDRKKKSALEQRVSGRSNLRLLVDPEIITNSGPGGYKCPVSTCGTETFCTHEKLEKHWAETHEKKKETYPGKSSFLYFTEGAGSFENPYRCQQAIIGNSLLATFENYIPSGTARYIDPGEHKLKIIKKEPVKMEKEKPKSKMKDNRSEREKQSEKEISTDQIPAHKAEVYKCPVPACFRKVNKYTSEARVQNHWEKIHQKQFTVKYFCSSCPDSKESSVELAHHLKDQHKFKEEAMNYYIDNVFVTKVSMNSVTYIHPGTHKLKGIQIKVVMFEDFIQMIEKMVKNEEQKRKLSGEINIGSEGEQVIEYDILKMEVDTGAEGDENKDVNVEGHNNAKIEGQKDAKVDQEDAKVGEQEDVKVEVQKYVIKVDDDQKNIKEDETENAKMETGDEEVTVNKEAGEDDTKPVKPEVVKEVGESVKVETMNGEVDTHVEKVDGGATDGMQVEAGECEVETEAVKEKDTRNDVDDAEAMIEEAGDEMVGAEDMKIKARFEMGGAEAMQEETGDEVGVTDTEAVKEEDGDEVGNTKAVKKEDVDEAEAVKGKDEVGDTGAVKGEDENEVDEAEAKKEKDEKEAEPVKGKDEDEVGEAEAVKVEMTEDGETELGKTEAEHGVGCAEAVKAKYENSEKDITVENGKESKQNESRFVKAVEMDEKEEKMEVNTAYMNTADQTEKQEHKTTTDSGDNNGVQKKVDTSEETKGEQEEEEKLELDSKAEKSKSTKIVVLIRGLPGAGKSYIAKLLKVQRTYFLFV